MINEWELTTTNLHRVRRQQYEVAVLPVGATEPHNLHLPYGMDAIHATEIARRCSRDAWDRGAKVLCLPAIAYGVDANLMGFAMAMHVSQDTLNAMVRDVVVSLRAHGIRKVVILNSHGGNDFGPLVRQLQCDRDVHVFICDWWTVGRDRYEEIFDKPDDHAGQMETSVALAICPELVETDQAGDGKARSFRFEALEKGWVRTSRDFAKLNDHCGVGDPSGASAERGQAYLRIIYQRVTDFLAELATAGIDDTFPMSP